MTLKPAFLKFTDRIKKPDSMKSQITTENIMRYQTLLVYLLLISVIIICVYQIPHIAEFIRDYRDTMKAALPVN